jgi:hypothetical protein
MFAIAFHESEFLYYEGQVGYGRAIWPAPVLSVATVIAQPEDIKNISESNKLATNHVFREDSFDPVTRIRRGRMYEWAQGYSQPHSWNVQPHPAYSDEFTRGTHRGGALRKSLFTWQAWPAFQKLGGPLSRPLIALGSRDAYTLWRVVDIERIVTNEDLLTLRARGALGVLPELNELAIPEDGRAKVIDTIAKLADGAYRAGSPESVVDLARAATQWSLSVWLANKRGDPKIKMADLGELVKMLESDRTKSVAQILARLHSRAKPNEQERYESRPLSEEDAEFALASVAMLLRELGWAR